MSFFCLFRMCKTGLKRPSLEQNPLIAILATDLVTYFVPSVPIIMCKLVSGRTGLISPASLSGCFPLTFKQGRQTLLLPVAPLHTEGAKVSSAVVETPCQIGWRNAERRLLFVYRQIASLAEVHGRRLVR